MRDREGGEAEIGFGLAAAGGEEQEVHDLAIRVLLFDEAGKVEEDEGKLEGPPCGRVHLLGRACSSIAASRRRAAIAIASFMIAKASRARALRFSRSMPLEIRACAVAMPSSSFSATSRRRGARASSFGAGAQPSLCRHWGACRVQWQAVGARPVLASASALRSQR